MRKIVFICLLYWIILSERLTAEGIIVGILATLIVLYFNKDKKKGTGHLELINFNNIRVWSFYVIVLLKEILVANLHVAKIVLSRELKISPVMVRVGAGVKSDINKVILANSITLTPGTLTVEIEEDDIMVHCLDEKSAEGAQNSKFKKIIMESEG